MRTRKLRAKCNEKKCSDFGSSGEQGDDSRGQAHGEHVVEGGRESAQHVEGGQDEDGQEEAVVVEDREGGGLVLGNLVLFPQRALVPLFLADLLIVSQLLAHLLSHGGLALDGDLVLERVLGVPVGEGSQPGGEEGDGGEERRRGGHVHVVQAPEEPDGHGRHDEGIAVEQRRGLSRHL